jgi:dienelactone hydrolase
MRVFVTCGVMILICCAGQRGARAAEREQSFAVPVTDARGHTLQLKGRACYTEGAPPATLVLINHGSPPNASDRSKMELGRCGCSGGQYFSAGLVTAADIDATVRGLSSLPFIKPGGAVIVGQSAGGWGTIAYDSVAHPQVAAFVDMAGGRGGHRDDRPHNNCRPDLLVAAAGRYGKTASTPMLWIYTENDSYFAPPLARAMWQEFTAAGGQAEFVNPGPFDGDGHHLFFGAGGSAIWGPLVERYLKERGVAPHASEAPQ